MEFRPPLAECKVIPHTANLFLPAGVRPDQSLKTGEPYCGGGARDRHLARFE